MADARRRAWTRAGSRERGGSTRGDATDRPKSPGRRANLPAVLAHGFGRSLVPVARRIPLSPWCLRNAFLASTGYKAPIAKKTGTTICGIIYKDGVVLGADTRATEGSIVADKNCAKIHYISKFIYCCGAGTAADTENVTDVIASQLELHRLATGQEPRVNTAMTRLKQKLFQYQVRNAAGGEESRDSNRDRRRSPVCRRSLILRLCRSRCVAV